MGWESNSYDWMAPGGGGYVTPTVSGYQPVTSAPSFDWGGVTSGLFGLADTWLKADTAIKMQKASDGSRYLEGQRLAYQGGAMQIPIDLLIVGGIAAVFLLMKD